METFHSGVEALRTRIHYVSREELVFGKNSVPEHPDIDFVSRNGINVEWGGYARTPQEHLTEIENYGSFVFSKVDCHHKFSLGYGPCIGLLVSAFDRLKGINISFLSHQTPHAFGNKNFEKKLQLVLHTICASSDSKTVEAIVFGGRKSKNEDILVATDEWSYDRPVRFLKNVLIEAGITKTDIIKPKLHSQSSSVYFNNETRDFFLVESRSDIQNKSS